LVAAEIRLECTQVSPEKRGEEKKGERTFARWKGAWNGHRNDRKEDCHICED